jgi:hypothetical protein
MLVFRAKLAGNPISWFRHAFLPPTRGLGLQQKYTPKRIFKPLIPQNPTENHQYLTWFTPETLFQSAKRIHL